MIEVKNVVKTFDGFAALNDATISVPTGAVYGLVGPNGAGKSTIIRHLTGIFRQDSGTVRLGGEDVWENAALKAKAIMAASGLPAIADDSGLCVNWLNGAPGVYSARYGGLDDDAARYRLLLQNLRGATDRSAYFHTAIVCAFPNGDVLTAEGDCHGAIAFAPMGDGGFGYDPVFLVPSLRKTFAQLTPEEKNAISHRGVALRAFGEKLKEYMENH